MYFLVGNPPKKLYVSPSQKAKLAGDNVKKAAAAKRKPAAKKATPKKALKGATR